MSNTKTHSLVFHRSDDKDDNIVAVLTLLITNEALLSATPLEVFKAGVAEWASSSEEGRRARDLSGGNLNIGDVLDYDAGFDFLRALKSKGIVAIESQRISLSNAINYDRQLLESSESADLSMA